MKIHLHKNAKTTPAQRAFIKASSDLNTSELSRKLGVSPTTVRKWKKRTSVYDRPHIPHKIPTVLTPLQEIVIIMIRLCLRSGLDDLQGIVRRFIYPDCARSSLNRCLKRYQISRLEPLPDCINDHRGIFLYYTVIHLPAFFKSKCSEFIHIFLDCSTRWVHIEINPDSYLHDPCQLIRTVSLRFPVKILGMIAGDLIDLSGTDTDIASEYHNCFIQSLNKIRQPFCVMTDHGHSITRGVIKKAGLSEIPPDALRFAGSFSGFKTRLLENLSFYNTRLCQRALRQKTPRDAVQYRYKVFPGSFRCGPE